MYKVSETVLPIYINGQCPIIKTCSDVTLNLSSKDSRLAGFPDILNKIRHNGVFGIAKNAKFPRLTPWQYVFNVTQKSVNKQSYWMKLTLLRPKMVRMWAWLKFICS